ncbi:MAG TPA: UDP-N-acetylmuramoyl-L-alanine--D-glutamate ligase, partial [Caldisericia bacterium]|nr:UDP-N-acetylmuramoyl-L-alanine--D-glutamate ligase [Caldisericia bacterium]
GKDIYIRGKKVSSLSDYHLVGDFNALNLMAASLAVSKFGIDPAVALSTAKDFVPLDHRLQFVGEWEGIKFINDSKSTKPEATILAVKSLPGPFVIILGGSEKGSDFSGLADNFSEVRYAVLHGATAPKIEKALRDGGFDRIIMVKDQSEAIKKAIKVAKPGDTVLLSPACASFDQFKDYEHRGRMFCQEVRELAQKGLRF